MKSNIVKGLNAAMDSLRNFYGFQMWCKPLLWTYQFIMLNHSATSFIIISFFRKLIYNSSYAVMYIFVRYSEKLNGSYCVKPFLSRKLSQHTGILLLTFPFHKVQCSFCSSEVCISL